MKIKMFTMTGADNSTTPEDLVEISKEFPFVEWGILCSRKSQGGKRFPTYAWLDKLALAAYDNPGMKLSCHLCGDYVREILKGDASLIEELAPIWPFFQRVQINTHGRQHLFSPSFPALLNISGKEFIFQYDNENGDLIPVALNKGVNCSTLFDLSHGAGILPEEWPQPVEGIKCGYAGGLSAVNLEGQIKNINRILSSEYETWLDMETHVRSVEDQIFDLRKVRACLQIALKSGYIS